MPSTFFPERHYPSRFNLNHPASCVESKSKLKHTNTACSFAEKADLPKTQKSEGLPLFEMSRIEQSLLSVSTQLCHNLRQGTGGRATVENLSRQNCDHFQNFQFGLGSCARLMHVDLRLPAIRNFGHHCSQFTNVLLLPL